jgi:hypothetical protein
MSLTSKTRAKIATDLAVAAIKMGSLRALKETIATQGSGTEYDPETWARIIDTKARWERIEAEYGPGAVLNLDHAVIISLTEATRHFRIPQHWLDNASRFRAEAPLSIDDLYIPGSRTPATLTGTTESTSIEEA